MLGLFEMFDPTVLALFGVVDACVGLVVGLLLVVVGFVTVRSASPNAGYLVGGAGALQLLTYCCGSWQEPAMVWLEMYELTESLGGISSAAALLFHLASAALMIVGAVLLARELTARREASGASPQGGA
jgi:hypothetical protein